MRERGLSLLPSFFFSRGLDQQGLGGEAASRALDGLRDGRVEPSSTTKRVISAQEQEPSTSQVTENEGKLKGKKRERRRSHTKAIR